MRPTFSSRPPDPAFFLSPKKARAASPGFLACFKEARNTRPGRWSCDRAGGRHVAGRLASRVVQRKNPNETAQVGRLFCALNVPKRTRATARPLYLNNRLTT